MSGVQHPLPDGVYADFSYTCKCGGPVQVRNSVRQPHECDWTERDEFAAALEDVVEGGGDSRCYDDMVSALMLRGYRKIETTTEWGLRRDADSAIWSEAAARETLQRQRKRKMKSFLIKRQVGPWELAEP